MSIDPNDIKVDLTKFYKTAPEDPATGEPRVGDPNNVKVDLTKFYKTSKATPEDPATGEPQDENPYTIDLEQNLLLWMTVDR